MIYRFFRRCIVLFATCFSLLTTSLVIAGDGHDHGDAKPAAVGPALPRFTAQSDLFDAVGILSGGELIVFIDRASTNEPVLNATVELESTGVKLVGKFEEKLGEYHFDGKAFAKTGEYPITLTVKAGKDTDLLTGDLDVRDAATAEAAGAAHSHGWPRIAQWSAAGLVLAALLFFGLRGFLRKQRSGRNRVGGAA
jgi:hypothetical protein